jgi:hypothetical protein
MVATAEGEPSVTRNMLKRIVCRGLGLLLLTNACAALPAFDTTLSGTDFDVLYDSTRLDLFGSPSLSGDTIFFTPTGFSATSLNGAGSQLTHATIDFELAAKPGFNFAQLQVVERGDYQLSGMGSTVKVTGQLSAFDPNNPINAFGFQFMAVPGSTPLTLNDGDLHPWQAGASLDVSHDPFSRPHALNVTLENLLTATTAPGAAGSVAFIEKKFAGAPISSLDVPAVPLPGALWLFGSGLLVLGPLLWRRRATG